MKYWKNQVSHALLNLFERFFLLLNLGVYSAAETLSTWTINRQTWTVFSNDERNLSNGYSYCGGDNDLKCISIVVNNHGMMTSMPRDAQEFGWAKRMSRIDVSERVQVARDSKSPALHYASQWIHP
jgi:hypothetical protein